MSEAGVPPRRAALEALLTHRHSSPVEVDAWEPLAPWAVARVTLRGATAPQTVIVKSVRTDGSRTEPWRLGAELAALRFLTDDLGVTLAPRVVAADLSQGLLVLEDLAPRTALDQLLRSDGAAAHADRLAAFARALGGLHAVTTGHADLHRSRLASLVPTAPQSDHLTRFTGVRAGAHRLAAVVGAPLTGPADAELSTALAELSDPGPFLALSNGDSESNNVLLCRSGPADARLIDFESAGSTHALLDAVCLHVPGPAWMTVGDPLATGLADHYRRALARGVPEAEDDRRFGFGLVAACVFWAIIRLQRFALLDARAPGDDSRPQLVETLEATARTAATHRVLPHLTGWLRRTADLLRRRWPDADLDFTDPAAFPPYTARR